ASAVCRGSAGPRHRPPGQSWHPRSYLLELVAERGKFKVEFGEPVALVGPEFEVDLTLPPVGVGVVILRLRRCANPAEEYQRGINYTEAISFDQTPVIDFPAFALAEVRLDRTPVKYGSPRTRVAVAVLMVMFMCTHVLILDTGLGIVVRRTLCRFGQS